MSRSYYLTVDLCLRAQRDNLLGKLRWFTAKAICNTQFESEPSGKTSQRYCHKACLFFFCTKWRKCSHGHKLRPCVARKPGFPLKYSKWWWTKVKWIGLSQTHNTSRTHSDTKNNRGSSSCCYTKHNWERCVLQSGKGWSTWEKAQAHYCREAFGRRTISHWTLCRAVTEQLKMTI